LLAPSQFTLDRVLAILHAILPHDLRTTIDMYTQIATLTGLKLLIKSAGLGSGDPLEPGTKWKVGNAVRWEYVQSLARSLKFDLLDYVAE
jgi:origin recognition complex subunit 5